MKHNGWTLTIIYKLGYPLRIWTNETKTRSIVFFCFGRYSSFLSDVDSLDLCVDVLCCERRQGPRGLVEYLSSLEDTCEIEFSQNEAA